MVPQLVSYVLLELLRPSIGLGHDEGNVECAFHLLLYDPSLNSVRYRGTHHGIAPRTTRRARHNLRATP